MADDTDKVKDMLGIIYQQLLADSTVQSLTASKNGQHRIVYYDYPDSRDQTGARLIIEPVGPPHGVSSGSDEGLNQQFTIQINAEIIGPDKRMVIKQLQQAVSRQMLKLGYGQLNDGLDEYFPDEKKFVDARRFRGNTKLYDNNY